MPLCSVISMEGYTYRQLNKQRSFVSNKLQGYLQTHVARYSVTPLNTNNVVNIRQEYYMTGSRGNGHHIGIGTIRLGSQLTEVPIWTSKEKLLSFCSGFNVSTSRSRITRSKWHHVNQNLTTSFSGAIDAYQLRRSIGLSLDQIVVCRLSCAKPLYELMLPYC